MIFEEYNEQKAMRAARKRAEKRFNEGIEQGKIEKQNALIKRMFEKKMSTEEIADITCLPTEEIQKILDSIHKQQKLSDYSGSFFYDIPQSFQPNFEENIQPFNQRVLFDTSLKTAFFNQNKKKNESR